MKKKGRKSGFGLNGTPSRPHWALTGALVASTVISSGAMSPLRAQEVESRPRSAHPQQQALPSQQFNIPQGLLGDALKAFEAATGIKIDLRASVDDVKTKGVSGDLTPQQALKQLLDGTSLNYVFTGKNSVVVHTRRGSDTMLDEISVAGDKKPGQISSVKYTEPPRNIPQSITVVPQTVIKSQNITSLRDVVRNIPGITMNAGEGGNYPGDKFNVRGFTAQSDMFIDGVRDVGAYSRDIFNIEQVEVTKGPNSTVSGRGSTGGTINMVTKSPLSRESRNATINVGSADLRRVAFDVNQPLDGMGYTNAAVRLNVVSSQSGVAGNEALRNKNWGIAPSLAVGLDGATQLNIGYSRSEQNNLPSYGISTYDSVPSVNTRRFFGLRGLDFEHVSSSQLTGRIDHQFGGFAHLRNQTIRAASNVGRIVTPLNPNTGARSPKTHVYENAVVSNQTNLNLSFETGGLKHSVSTGFEVSRENSKRGSFAIDTTGIGAYPRVLDLNNPTSNSDYKPTVTRRYTTRMDATSLGAYAFENLQIGDKVEFNGGLRWDSYDPEYLDSASNASGFTTRKSSAISGRAAIVVKPTGYSSFYTSYGTSFNPSNENLALDGLNATSELKPEKSRTYEVGTKWELFKQKLFTTFAVFRTEKTNARTSDPTDAAAVIVLAGKQRVEGAEFGITGTINPKWNVYGGYSLLSGKYTASLDSTQVGDDFLNIPKHSVNLWTTFQPTEAFSIGGGMRYMDKRLLRNTATVTTYVPSYHTYDAVASFQVNRNVGLQLNLNNLTDKLYYDSGRMWVPAAGRSVTIGTSLRL